MTFSVLDCAKMIDHSLLHPTMTDEDLMRGCTLARKLRCASVCIKPYAVKTAVEILKGSDVLTGTVIGFPHGNSSLSIKIREATEACIDGASEIDMVINIGKVLGSDWSYIEEEIRNINDAVVSRDALLKVIFETDYLGDEEIIHLCEICSKVRPAFVKTSTGYGFIKRSDGTYSYRGATDHNLKLMRLHTVPEVAVKAAGGIRSLDRLLAVRRLGVTRCGATATEAILKEAERRAAIGTLS